MGDLSKTQLNRVLAFKKIKIIVLATRFIGRLTVLSTEIHCLVFIYLQSCSMARLVPFKIWLRALEFQSIKNFRNVQNSIITYNK